jgi:hypothetical protein
LEQEENLDEEGVIQKANGAKSWRKYIITNFPKIHCSSIRRIVKELDDCGL